MANWGIKHNNGPLTLCSDLGISNINRVLSSQASDELTFDVMTAMMDDDALFEYQDTVELYRIEEDGSTVREFYGINVSNPRRGDDQQEMISYRIMGIWHWLANVGYEQIWKAWDGAELAEYYKSHILMGRNAEGDKVSTNELLVKALEFARDIKGVPLTIGSIEPDISIESKELHDVTIAEFINQVMRWHPDCVVWVDHRTMPTPTLHIRRRMSLPSIELRHDSRDFTIIGNEITERYDLRPSCVVIKYEKTINNDGNEWEQVVVDKYPLAANEHALGVLPITIALAGSSSSTMTQRIKTETVDVDSANWWRRKLGLVGAEGAKYTEFTVSSGQLLDTDGNAIESLDRELIDGNIADWMGKEEAEAVATANITFTYDPGGGKPLQKRTNFPKSYQLRVTDASSGVYQQQTDYDPGDPVPTGVAQTMYESLSDLQYEGSISLVGEEATREQYLGKVLNIMDMRPEWQNMRAMITQVREHIDSGTTVITFGPVRWLGAGDIVDLYRQNRGRTTFSSARLGGKANAGKPEAGDKTPRGNTTDGTQHPLVFEMEPSDEGNGVKFTGDSLPSEIPEGVDIRLRWVYGCNDEGNETRMLVMGSQEFPVEEEEEV